MDDLTWPFSLFPICQSQMVTRGDVTNLFDKSIGRPVFSIKGSINANNFIVFDHLQLQGHLLHIQLRLLKPYVATLHIELTTADNVGYRLSASTLYAGDQPRFLGRSLRYVLEVAITTHGAHELFFPRSSHQAASSHHRRLDSPCI